MALPIDPSRQRMRTRMSSRRFLSHSFLSFAFPTNKANTQKHAHTHTRTHVRIHTHARTHNPPNNEGKYPFFYILRAKKKSFLQHSEPIFKLSWEAKLASAMWICSVSWEVAMGYIRVPLLPLPTHTVCHAISIASPSTRASRFSLARAKRHLPSFPKGDNFPFFCVWPKAIA